MKTTLRLPLIAGTAGICIVLFAALTPPERTEPLTAGVGAFSEAPNDTLVYGERFALSFLLLGVVPCGACALLWTSEPRAVRRVLGVVRPARFFSPWFIAGYVVVGCAFGAVGAASPDLSTYYPYHPRLPEIVRATPWIFPAHALVYLCAYYVPWEILFRGILILPFLSDAAEAGQNEARMYGIAALQAVPSALLHFGHPVSESLSAVVFGLAAGWLVVKTRSVVPPLIVHAAAGISLDLLIILAT